MCTYDLWNRDGRGHFQCILVVLWVVFVCVALAPDMCPSMISVYTSDEVRRNLFGAQEPNGQARQEKQALYIVLRWSKWWHKREIFMWKHFIGKSVYFNRQRSVKTSSKSQDVYIKKHTHTQHLPWTPPPGTISARMDTRTPAKTTLAQPK